MDLVSVIVPMYNSQKYIKKCLESLINQTYENIEIIVVNDGSTDNSLKIINEIAQNDARIKIFNQENKGANIARMNGLNYIDKETQFFTFCDADDYYHKEYIRIMVETIKKYSADIVACPTIRFIGPFKKHTFSIDCFNKQNIYNSTEIINNLYFSYFGITNFPGYLHSKLYDIKWADHMINMPQVVKFMADDLSINIRILPLCKKIVTIPSPLYYYRLGGGTSKFMPDFMNDYMEYHKLQLELIEKYNLPREYLYFSCIEIINVLHTWILMCSMNETFSESDLYNELLKWRTHEEIIFALNCTEKWQDNFKDLLKNNELRALLNIVYQEKKREKIKIFLKNIIKSVADYF